MTSTEECRQHVTGTVGIPQHGALLRNKVVIHGHIMRIDAGPPSSNGIDILMYSSAYK